MTVQRLLLLLLVGVETASARPAQIILFRHAEKPPEESNVHLSDRGRERARALVSFLTTDPALITNGLPMALFAPRISPRGHARRAYETLEPLAERLKLPVQMPSLPKDYATLARQVLHDRACDGKTVVICWVHDYLPKLAEALGVKPRPNDWKGSLYDRVWVITYHGNQAVLATRWQHLLAGDSAE